MSFPNIFDWLDRLEFLRGYPAAMLVLLTAVIIILSWDWHVSLSALAIQYFAIALLYADILPPQLAIIKLLVGWFVCLILYITARQVRWGGVPDDITPEEEAQFHHIEFVKLGPVRVPKSFPIRTLLVAGALLLIFWWTQSASPNVSLFAEWPDYLSLALNTLVGMGLLGLATTTEPLKAGMGLLMFLAGFELFYASLEQAAIIFALLAAVNLIIAVVVSYLTQRQYSVTAIFD